MPKRTCPNCKQEFDKKHRPKGLGYRLTTGCCSTKCRKECDKRQGWTDKRSVGLGLTALEDRVTRDDLNGNAKRQIDLLEMGEEF